jgi:hypothetical protein
MCSTAIETCTLRQDYHLPSLRNPSDRGPFLLHVHTQIHLGLDLDRTDSTVKEECLSHPVPSSSAPPSPPTSPSPSLQHEALKADQSPLDPQVTQHRSLLSESLAIEKIQSSPVQSSQVWWLVPPSLLPSLHPDAMTALFISVTELGLAFSTSLSLRDLCLLYWSSGVGGLASVRSTVLCSLLFLFFFITRSIEVKGTYTWFRT